MPRFGPVDGDRNADVAHLSEGEAIIGYLDASRRFEEAEATVTKLAARLDSIAKMVRGADFSGSRRVRPGFIPSVNDWTEGLPERNELREALVEFSEAKDAVKAAFDAVPEERKAGVAPPPRGI